VEEARRPVDNSRTVRSQRIGGWSEGTLSLFPLSTFLNVTTSSLSAIAAHWLLTGYICVSGTLYGRATGARVGK
jgi:hypothetical protein